MESLRDTTMVGGRGTLHRHINQEPVELTQLPLRHGRALRVGQNGQERSWRGTRCGRGTHAATARAIEVHLDAAAAERDVTLTLAPTLTVALTRRAAG